MIKRNKELAEFKQEVHNILKNKDLICVEKLNQIYNLL